MRDFERNIIDIFGETGKQWLDQLPDLVEKSKIKWGLQEVKPFSNLTYSYVGRTVHDDRPSVLKIMPPCDRFTRECEWYQNQSGRGSPHLFAFDKESGALLIERMQPASSAKNLVLQGDDRGATNAIAKSILGLKHQPPKKEVFPHVNEFVNDLIKLKPHVQESLLTRAIFLLKDLTSDASKDVLLHGDLHHDNVLKHGDHWVAIDPHGFIGPRSFEVGAMLRNPYDCFPTIKPLDEVIKARVNVLEHQLPFSRYEIQAWSLIYTLVSSSWSLDDHGDVPDEHIQIAQILSSQINTENSFT